MVKYTQTNNMKKERLIIECLFKLGVRVTELCDLRVDNIIFERAIIKVVGKGDKSRYITIDETLLELLYEVKNQTYVIEDEKGLPRKRQHINYRINKLCRDASIGKMYEPHAFRRGYATHLHNKEVSLVTASKAMGHSSPSVTANYYTIVDQEGMRKQLKGIFK